MTFEDKEHSSSEIDDVELNKLLEFLNEIGGENHYTREYNQAGVLLRDNPLFAWSEIGILPTSKELPIWVREYLQRVAFRLIRLTALESISATQASAKVAGELGLIKDKPDKWNAFSNLKACSKALSAAIAVHNKAQLGKREFAVEDVAKLLGRSKRTIFRWIQDAAKHNRVANDLRSQKKPPLG